MEFSDISTMNNSRCSLILKSFEASGCECRMGDVILEAITKLKEPRGSSRAAIMQYVEVLVFCLLIYVV